MTFLIPKEEDAPDVSDGLDLDPEVVDAFRGGEEVARRAADGGPLAGLYEAALRRPHHHTQRPGQL